MTESAAKLLDLLHERRLLPDLLIDSLRKQVAAAPSPLQAHHIAKLLQQKGKITAFQARELLAAVEGRRTENSSTSPSPSPSPEPLLPAPGSDELDLAAIDEDTPKTQRRATKASPTSQPTAKTPNKNSAPAAPSLFDAAPSLGGGIDDLLSDPALMQSAQSAYDPLGIAQPQRKRGWLRGLFGGGAKHKPRASGWESPLFIVGGGALLLLLLVGGTLALVLLRSSGDDLFKAAELDYANSAYGQAIAKYEKFLKGRSNHPQASLARVRIGLARLRSASAGGDADAALQRAETILPTLAGEPALAEARPELASLLPGVAENFAEAAAQATDTSDAAKHVAQYRAAMKLVDDPLYLPTSVKAPLAAQLERMQQHVDAALHEIEQADRLRKTIAAISAAVKKHDAAAGYDAHRALLALYPRLSASEELRAAVAAISDSLREQVQSVEPTYSPVAEDHTSPAVAEIAVAKPSSQRVAQLAGRIVPMVIDGVLYVVAADDGRLLWRRFVGRDVASAQLAGDEAAADVIVADSQRQELLRLRGTDGKLSWRLPVGESLLFGPTVNEQFLLTLASGTLLSIDAATGSVAKQIVFPQPLAVTAALSPGGNGLLQCGDHSNLYVLDAKTLACTAVYYLGHKTGTIEAPPQRVGPLVVVPQQAGLRRAMLHVLAFGGDDARLHAAQPPLAIDQQIALPLLADGRRATVFDRRGAIRIFEAQDAGDATMLAIVAEKSGAGEGAAPLAALADGLLIVADERLAGHRIRTARGTLPAAWASHDGDQFIAPLHVSGGYVFHARRQAGKPGAIISAAALAPANEQQAGQPLWQTHVALPPADAAIETATGEIKIVCAGGDRYILPPSPSGFVALNQPQTDARELAHASHTAWRGGWLVPNDRGQIELVPQGVVGESDSPPERHFPFQPPQQPGEPPQWFMPAPIDDQRFVAADRRGTVYIVRAQREGAPHLAAALTTNMERPLVAGPAVSGAFVVVVERGEDFDALVALGIADLQPQESLALSGRVAWGPQVVGDLLLVVVAPGTLVAVRAPAVEVWQCDLGGQRLAAVPVVHAGTLWLATTAGRLLQLSLETGATEGEMNFAQPLAAGPAVIGDRIVVRASDGTAIFAELPR